ncbi:MAG TPA: Spy/CpxP family protein refolding chaperone [Thermoanaerobaculia bacterium]|nr:Spy/CpxP family protein refolding chaperone [Thermoanaerobaculia bacterium]
MNTKKWMTVAATLALSTSIAIAAPHGGRGEGKSGGKRGHGEFEGRFAEKLNLTDAQKAQIKTIRQNNREQNKAVFEQSRETFKQFWEAKKAGDTARVEQLKPVFEQQRAQVRQLLDAERQLVLALLTPEQRAQYEALKAERESRRGQRGERHRNN